MRLGSRKPGPARWWGRPGSGGALHKRLTLSDTPAPPKAEAITGSPPSAVWGARGHSEGQQAFENSWAQAGRSAQPADSTLGEVEGWVSGPVWPGAARRDTERQQRRDPALSGGPRDPLHCAARPAHRARALARKHARGCARPDCPTDQWGAGAGTARAGLEVNTAT